MFTIIGGDGKEYGPVSAEQIRSWIESRRANLDTKAKALGSEEWRRLGDYAEFNDHLTPPEPVVVTQPSPTPPPVGDVDAKAFAADVIARARPLDVMGCMERGWEVLKANFWAVVGTTFLVIMFEALISKLCGYLPGPQYHVTDKIVLGMDTWASVLIDAPIYGGLYYYILKKARGQPTEINEAFGAMGRFFVPLFLAGIVSSLLTGIGCVLLILPGIYLAVAYSFAKLLVIDRQMPFWTALEVSRRVVSSQWFSVLGLWLLATFVAVLGLIGLVIGVFITIPILFTSTACAYDDLFNPPPRS